MVSMRGILSWGGYLPYRRLDRTLISAVAGSGGGNGTRTVASYDEDTTTMGAAAARYALLGAAAGPRALWFATTEPAYLDKTNATAVHAARLVVKHGSEVVASGRGRVKGHKITATLRTRGRLAERECTGG